MQHSTIHDYYGGPGEIPDKIEKYGTLLTPYDVLNHVRAKTHMGLKILGEMNKYQREHPLWLEGEKLKEGLRPKEKSMDEAILMCACGDQTTYPEYLQQIITFKPDNAVVSLGLKAAIRKFYGAKEDECVTQLREMVRVADKL